jgi:hypothetical protein
MLMETLLKKLAFCQNIPFPFAFSGAIIKYIH